MAHIQKRTYTSKKTGKPTTAWQARYRGPDGRERTKRFARRVDAERWTAVNEGDVAQGTWIDPSAGQVSLREYANRWLEQRGALRSTTSAKYRGLLDRHIFPNMGDTCMRKLTPSRVRDWHAALFRVHPSTAAGAYRLLASICRTAVDDEVIARTPCRVKGAGTERATERPVATVAETAAAVGACPEKYQLAILLALWCQLRRQEVLGLQRRDINLLHGTLTISRTWTLQPDGRTVLGPPKTDAGRRQLVIPKHVLDALESHLACFTGPEPTAWLFPGEEGNPVSPRTIDRVWATARKAAGRPDLCFHDVRHTGLTLAAGLGATTAELMHRGGHKSHAAAIRYQHATKERDAALADAMSDLADAKVLPMRRTNDGQSSGTGTG